MDNVLVGMEPEWDGKTRTQVYQATHDGGDNRLPLMNRAFISFAYGGKPIEDFGLIATIEGDRLVQQLYGNFEDLTSSYTVLDGQFYWGTHFTTNQFSFTLATDEITENQLDDFKHWFMPGQVRELVLAEHPNRAILARIDTPPTYSFIPFEKKTTITIGHNTYDTSTTVYRGTVQLSFVTDDPYWYSLEQFIDDTYEDEDGVTHSSLENKDILKVMLEDNIPYKQMLLANCFLGGKKFAVGLGNPTVGSATTETPRFVVGPDGYNPITSVPKDPEAHLSKLGITLSGEGQPGAALTANAPQYLYYCGTAPATTQLSFTLTPQFDDSTGYIIAPYNSIARLNEEKPYNYIQIGESVFRFTTPGIYTGYNQALQIIDNAADSNASWAEVAMALRLQIKEYYSRAWAIMVLEQIKPKPQSSEDNDSTDSIWNGTGKLDDGWKSDFKTKMKKFLQSTDDDNSSILSGTFTFDSKTGTATGAIDCRAYELDTETTQDNVTTVTAEENVGDMVCSDYLIIRDRSVLRSDHQVTKDVCLKVTTDYPSGLTNVLISYKNMYL